jgi:uncharacterized membrane-anchored protein YitT (DUF2179 family)
MLRLSRYGGSATGPVVFLISVMNITIAILCFSLAGAQSDPAQRELFNNVGIALFILFVLTSFTAILTAGKKRGKIGVR